jgi:hypothetical protein
VRVIQRYALSLEKLNEAQEHDVPAAVEWLGVTSTTPYACGVHAQVEDSSHVRNRRFYILRSDWIEEIPPYCDTCLGIVTQGLYFYYVFVDGSS